MLDITNNAAVISLKDRCLTDYFENGLSISELVRIYKRSRDTIRDWIGEANQTGRTRTKILIKGPTPNKTAKPLSPLHRRIGTSVYKWRQSSLVATTSAAAEKLGYSLFTYSKIELGIYNLSLLEAIELAQSIGAPEIITL